MSPGGDKSHSSTPGQRSGFSGALAGCTPWTQEEIDALCVAWDAGGIYAARAALPHRSVAALYHKTQRLGRYRRRRWTLDDDRRLRALWSGETQLRQIAATLRRTTKTTYWRAQKLGLPLGCPHGWEYLSRAAKRTGYCTTQLRPILEAADVEVRHALARPAKRRGKRGAGRFAFIVWPADVDVAVARWLETEPLSAAARRVGVSADTLARRLLSVGVEKPRVGKFRWRIHPDEVALALAQPRPAIGRHNAERGPRGRYARKATVRHAA